jgi:hypothetical protein
MAIDGENHVFENSTLRSRNPGDCSREVTETDKFADGGDTRPFRQLTARRRPSGALCGPQIAIFHRLADWTMGPAADRKTFVLVPLKEEPHNASTFSDS